MNVTKNINFKNFDKKVKSNNVRKNFRIFEKYFKKNNQVLNSLSSKYKYSYSKKIN